MMDNTLGLSLTHTQSQSLPRSPTTTTLTTTKHVPPSIEYTPRSPRKNNIHTFPSTSSNYPCSIRSYIPHRQQSTSERVSKPMLSLTSTMSATLHMTEHASTTIPKLGLFGPPARDGMYDQKMKKFHQKKIILRNNIIQKGNCFLNETPARMTTTTPRGVGVDLREDSPRSPDRSPVRSPEDHQHCHQQG